MDLIDQTIGQKMKEKDFLPDPLKNKRDYDKCAAGFEIRPAVCRDLPGIMKVMEEADNNPEHPDWFVSDGEAYVQEHLSQKGFVIVAENKKTEEIAGFFMVKYPEEGEWHPGVPLSLGAEDLAAVAVMDSAAVLKKYRGNHLQQRMLHAAEEKLKKLPYKCLVCTIHPDNRYSRANMEQNGYQVMMRTKCYGGKDRLILMKRWKDKGGKSDT